MTRTDNFVEEIVAEALELGRRSLTGRTNQIVKVQKRSGTKASLTVDPTGTNNALVFTAVQGGDAGEDITIAYTDPGAFDQDLAVTVDGTDIEFSLATGPDPGAITSTADDIKAALLDSEEASALVTAADAAANDGSGVVTEMVAAPLAGGTEGVKLTLRDGTVKLLTVTASS